MVAQGLIDYVSAMVRGYENADSREVLWAWRGLMAMTVQVWPVRKVRA